MIVAEAVADYVKENERVWENDRTQTVGASEIGQCSRKVFALKFEREPGMSVPRDPDFVDTWGARERGNLIEKHLLVPAIVKCYGDKALLLGSQQQTFVDGMLSCTPDCLIDDSEQLLLEFKSIDPRVNLGAEAKPEHIFQAQVQMGMLHALTKYRPAKCIISYTDASFLSDTKEFVEPYNPRFYEIAKRRATKIMTAESMHELDPEGWIAGGKECDYCPFTIACGQSRRRIPEEDLIAQADPQFIAEISDRAKQLKYAEGSIAVAEKQFREIQYEIKERLREKGLRRVVGDGVSISWSPVKGRETTDTAALKEAAKAAGIDVEAFHKTGEPGDRLTVVLKTPKESGDNKSTRSKAA